MTVEIEQETALVPLQVDGALIYMSVQQSEASGGQEEEEIGWRPPTLEQALDGLMGVARAMGTRLQQSDASRVTVEFGCEFLVESGKLVTVIGKASGKSSFKVALEWTTPTPAPTL
ncbi:MULTISPECIES: CU044_2847 family protein [Actinomadura]|uniref:Trypsin-co-occurring domain-containing protein n=2 Tax=Actinomadura TaxID=1988 RepID=A0A239P7L5_9ACTN|nr:MULTISPECIES: CU044_2847 family protein [Actinomadura]TMR38226.1 hypothetical protein ETD96_16805 [Actinomadura geliboluensis]SNT63031.1 hypothetical protein SAMN05443665_10835 [Actinomadura meyerae]